MARARAVVMVRVVARAVAVVRVRVRAVARAVTVAIAVAVGGNRDHGGGNTTAGSGSGGCGNGCGTTIWWMDKRLVHQKKGAKHSLSAVNSGSIVDPTTIGKGRNYLHSTRREEIPRRKNIYVEVPYNSLTGAKLGNSHT